MSNFILENTDQVEYFTNMREILDAANIAAVDYDWYISDVETNWTPAGLNLDDRWLRGEELADILRDHDLQFEWAVFSAVPKGSRPTISSPPYADGYRGYWQAPEPKPQLEAALFEIACWDSSATILINLPEEAARSFVTAYPDTQPLAAARASSSD